MRSLLALLALSLCLALAVGVAPTYAAEGEEEDKKEDGEKTADAEKKVGAKPAGSSSELEDEMEFLEEEQRIAIVVTASKHGQKITEAPAAVTVISSEDIQASGAVTIADLFRRVPGLDFMQTSARDYNLNTRGFNNTLSRRLLVLVDGRSVYLDLMGFTPWDLIQVPIDDIERIEIVRGPGSALYGANATSGVVNIITKTPKEIDGGSVRMSYGEFSTADVGVVFGKAKGDFGYKVSLGYFQTDAFSNPEKDKLGSITGGALNESELQQEGKVASQQPKGSFRFQYDIADDSRWVLDAGYSETSGILYTGIGPLEIQDGSSTPFMRTSYSKGNFYTQFFWNSLDGETINLFQSQSDPVGARDTFVTNAYDYEAQYNFQAGDRNFFVIGGNARLSDLTSSLTSKDVSETLFGVYAQDEIKFSDKLTGNVAFRVDADELVGTVFAPKAGLLYAFNPNHSVRLTAATAYNSSSFIESYLSYQVSPIPGIVITATGNEDLEPERIVSYELGYRAFPIPELLLDINVYQAKLKDYVQFIATEYYTETLPKTFTYINAGEADQLGAEFSIEYYPTDHFSLFANYSYTDTNQDKQITDVQSNHKAGLTAQYTQKKGFNGSLGVNYSDELVFPASTAFYPSGTLPSYTLFNGAAFWRFLDEGALSVGLRGTNLTNKKHQEFIAGDLIERKVVAELTYRF